MAGPLLTRVRVLAAKAEGTPGTPEALTGAEAAFNVFDPTIQQVADEALRQKQGGFGLLVSDVGAKLGEVKFSMEIIAPSAQPLWADTFLPACGLGWDGAKFILDPIPPEGAGSTQHTLTIGCYENGLFKEIYGAMGNARFTFDSAKRAMIEFTFRGIWCTPSDVAILGPVYPTDAPLQFISSALLIGAWTPKVAQFTLDLGNEIYVREDSSIASGYSSAVIGNRRPNGTLNPEAELVATKALLTEWEAETTAAVSWQCNRGAATAAFNAGHLQFLNPQEADRNGVAIHDLAYQLLDDDLQIVFSDGTTTTVGATTTA